MLSQENSERINPRTPLNDQMLSDKVFSLLTSQNPQTLKYDTFSGKQLENDIYFKPVGRSASMDVCPSY